MRPRGLAAYCPPPHSRPGDLAVWRPRGLPASWPGGLVSWWHAGLAHWRPRGLATWRPRGLHPRHHCRAGRGHRARIILVPGARRPRRRCRQGHISRACSGEGPAAEDPMMGRVKFDPPEPADRPAWRVPRASRHLTAQSAQSLVALARWPSCASPAHRHGKTFEKDKTSTPSKLKSKAADRPVPGGERQVPDTPRTQTPAESPSRLRSAWGPRGSPGAPHKNCWGPALSKI